MPYTSLYLRIAGPTDISPCTISAKPSLVSQSSSKDVVIDRKY